jgi:hypothetical protein
MAPPGKPPMPADEAPDVPCGGWFFSLEAAAVAPSLTHLKTSRDGAGTFLGQVHSQDLDWTALGEIDLGYRFGCGDGIGFSFRALSSSGDRQSVNDPLSLEPGFFVGFNAGLTAPNGFTFSTSSAARELHTRFDLQRYDIDYLSAERTYGPSFHVGWLGGARLVALHLDSSATDFFTITAQPSAMAAANGALPMILPVALRQSAKMDTTAGGVHLAGYGAWAPAANGLELFGKADAGFLVGGSSQKYGVSAITGLGGFPELDGHTHGTMLVTTANLEAGISYTIPLERIWLRLSAGYLLETYWFSATGGGASQHALFKEIDLIDHGPFARFEVRF